MKQEVLRNSGALLTQRFQVGETAVDADGDVDVTVTSSDGTDTDGTATSTGNGRYTYALAPFAEVDLLTVTWSGTFSGVVQSISTQVEVVGGHYFALSELRAMPGLSDVQRYPTAKLAEARQKAQNELERDIGAAFVERFGTITLTGGGQSSLLLRPYVRRILGVTVAGLAYGEDAIAALVPDPLGQLRRTYGVFGMSGVYNDVVVRFVHAWSDSPPTDVHDAALELARQHALGWRSFVADDPVEADDLGRETPSGEAIDRRGGQDQIAAVVASWRRRLLGYRRASSLSVA